MKRRSRRVTEYVTVRIPRELAEEIDEVLRSRIHGYRSRAEIVNEAVRLRLETLTLGKSMKSSLMTRTVSSRQIVHKLQK